MEAWCKTMKDVYKLKFNELILPDEFKGYLKSE